MEILEMNWFGDDIHFELESDGDIKITVHPYFAEPLRYYFSKNQGIQLMEWLSRATQ